MGEEEYAVVIPEQDWITAIHEGVSTSTLTITAEQLEHLSLEGMTITRSVPDEITQYVKEKLDEQANKIYDVLKSLDRIEITREEWMSLLGE